MSGIAGCFALDGRPMADAAAVMSRAIEHRGRDGDGIWSVGPVGLAYRNLKTTPESQHEVVPLAEHGLAITADARIDNRNELFETLGIGGSARERFSDPALILRAYQEWGEGTPEHLVGDFAFAVYDIERRSLFCARDRTGVRPFYYYHSSRLFAFASELKGLLHLPEIPATPSDQRIAEYLSNDFSDPRATFFAGLLRLPPGFCISVSQQGARTWPYWALDPELEIRYRDEGEYAEHFREIFFEAVRCRLRSAYPVGSLLSGGLDSSSIVCVARAMLRDQGIELHTFSAIFPEITECDERPFIESVVAGGGVISHTMAGDALSPLHDFDELGQIEDEPIYTPNLYLSRGLYRMASQQGVRVLLDGLNGDSIVSHGAAYLAELAGDLRWIETIRLARMLARNFNGSTNRLLWKHAVKPNLPVMARKALRSIRPAGRASILRHDLAVRSGLTDTGRAARELAAPTARSARSDHARRLAANTIPIVLELVGRVGSTLGLEIRSPFTDHRLIEYCLAIPADQKINREYTRVVMRRALADLLPPEVANRRGKGTMGPAFLKLLLRHERATIERVLFGGGTALPDYVDMKGLRRSFDRFVASGGSADASDIWSALTLNLWLVSHGFAGRAGEFVRK